MTKRPPGARWRPRVGEDLDCAARPLGSRMLLKTDRDDGEGALDMGRGVITHRDWYLGVWSLYSERGDHLPRSVDARNLHPTLEQRESEPANLSACP